jgi:hypothetical protein
LFEPKNLQWAYIDDTQFLKDRGERGVDATEEEFLTEAGLEFHHAATAGFLSGFGQDNGTP